MIVASYTLADQSAEQIRLISQFEKDWLWEKKVLAELGIAPYILKNQVSDNTRLLSYGCGIGIDAATFALENYADEIEGWDTSAATIKLAKERYKRPNLTFRTLDLLNDTFSDNGTDKIIDRFDIIYLRLVLQHIPIQSIHYLLQTCKLLLKEAGYLIVHDVDRTQDQISPEKHPFSVITQHVQDYMYRCNHDPCIGNTVIDLLADLSFKRIKSRSIKLETDFEETKLDLSYTANMVDILSQQPLISSALWQSACQHVPINFQRTSYRFITIGQQ